MQEPGNENGTVETQGASLFYRQAGAGTPVLLLHAGVSDGRMW
jgi:pimeloyl-ACP methyl ester carboxylesterase